MAKKESIYKNVDLKQVKRELTRNVEYLSTVNIETINDDIEEVTDFRGIPTPKIIATLEQKLDSYIVLIKESLEQLHTVMRIESTVTEDMGELIESLEEHMKLIETYFESRPPEEIQLREHIVSVTRMKKNKKGDYVEVTSIARLIAANIPAQIKTRVKIQKIILGLLPVLNDLREGRKDQKLLRGGGEMSPAMKLRLMRKEKNART